MLITMLLLKQISEDDKYLYKEIKGVLVIINKFKQTNKQYLLKSLQLKESLFQKEVTQLIQSKVKTQHTVQQQTVIIIQQMNAVYVLVPFFKTDTKIDIENQSRKLLGLPATQQQINIHPISPTRFALQIPTFNLHFLEINSLLEDYNEIKIKINNYQNLLKDYQPPIINVEENLSQNPDQFVKKMKKYKDLKEENKKLKKLLQVQLQNTEKVREQTQKTMKVLREQFDALVFEISKKQKTSSQTSYESRSNPPESQPKDQHNKEKTSHSGGGKHINIR